MDIEAILKRPKKAVYGLALYFILRARHYDPDIYQVTAMRDLAQMAGRPRGDLYYFLARRGYTWQDSKPERWLKTQEEEKPSDDPMYWN